VIIGFTGTRKGMTEQQKDQLGLILTMCLSNMNTFHHGAAPGDTRQKADIEAAALAEAMGYTCQPHAAGADPLARNRDIVAASDILIAAPESDKEELRSGTWATVRYMRQAVKPVIHLSRGKA
jgi:hypothetical protein